MIAELFNRAKAKVKSDPFYSRGRWLPPFEFLNNVAARFGDDLAQDVRDIRGASALNVLPQSFFFSSQLTDFAAEFRAGISEVVRWTTYHIRAYATGGYQQRQYFTENIGASNGYYGTNLQVGGGMAGNEALVFQYLRCMPLPSQADFDLSITASVQAVAFGQWHEVLGRLCYLELKIADKTYLYGAPLFLFPAGMGPGSIINQGASGNAVTQRSTSYINNGDPSNRALYLVDPPLAILPNRTFVVNLNWQTAVAVTTAGLLGLFLDGWRIRAVQAIGWALFSGLAAQLARMMMAAWGLQT